MALVNQDSWLQKVAAVLSTGQLDELQMMQACPKSLRRQKAGLYEELQMNHSCYLEMIPTTKSKNQKMSTSSFFGE